MKAIYTKDSGNKELKLTNQDKGANHNLLLHFQLDQEGKSVLLHAAPQHNPETGFD